jgi:hypothetical protein
VPPFENSDITKNIFFACCLQTAYLGFDIQTSENNRRHFNRVWNKILPHKPLPKEGFNVLVSFLASIFFPEKSSWFF